MKRRTFLGTLLAAAGLGLARGTGLAPADVIGVDRGAPGGDASVCTNYAGSWHRCVIRGECPVDGRFEPARRSITPELMEAAIEQRRFTIERIHGTPSGWAIHDITPAAHPPAPPAERP